MNNKYLSKVKYTDFMIYDNLDNMSLYNLCLKSIPKYVKMMNILDIGL